MRREQKVKDKNQMYNIRSLLGEKGVAKIKKAKIAFVGTGTIGSNLAITLAGNGFTNFVFIDGDNVSKRNVPLCDAFSLEDVGKIKVTVLKNFLKAKYGRRIRIETYPMYVHNLPDKAMEDVDLVILGVDNDSTRLLVTFACMNEKKPMVVLGFWGWEASYMLTLPGKTACWSCLFRPTIKEEIEAVKRQHRCPEPEPNIPGAVVHGTVSRLVGIAANEITKYFLSMGKIVQYYTFHALTNEEDVRFLDGTNYLKPDPECPICQKGEWIDVSSIRRKN